MLYLRKKLLGFACAALFGCAVGVTDEDALGDFGIDQANVLNGLDAGGALPSLASSDAAVLSTPALSVPIPPAAPIATNTSAPVSTSDPSSMTSTSSSTSTPVASTPSTNTPATSTPPSTSTPPANATSSDAGSTTRDAGSSSTPTTPAPMCSPLKCNIHCALLARCCNEQNECMCLSPIRGCVLPPL